MKSIILLCLFLAGSMANGYGSVSVSYGMNTPPVVSYGPAPATPPRSVYSAPAPATPVLSYSAPAPAAPIRSSYSAPATPVRSYSAPATPVRSSYSAPAPAAPVLSYSAPATPVRSYSAPATPVRSSYSAPAPAAPVLSYSAPAPATPVNSYSAPAPASPAAYGPSYGASNAAPIAITRFTQEMQEGSHHHTSYETEHGIRHEERTSLRMNPNAVGTPEDALAGRAIVTKTGSFSYMSPEGQPISTGFNANENGADFTGQHLPVPVTDTPEVAQARREHLAAVDEALRVIAQNPEVPQSYGGYSAPAQPLRVPSAPLQFRSPY
ncbi:unnamed protein product [Allacma fusca]|uniref:Uncharacterized protein n=1 Tax=Allacma fusca TaxID=39272 RepID=A0A8J2KZI2_9HEXA|nr:unnamed protein product [Allacma fusca]